MLKWTPPLQINANGMRINPSMVRMVFSNLAGLNQPQPTVVESSPRQLLIWKECGHPADVPADVLGVGTTETIGGIPVEEVKDQDEGTLLFYVDEVLVARIEGLAA